MRRSLALLLCATLAARASAGAWPLRRRAPKKAAEEAADERLRRSSERLNTYETALSIQHHTLMELRQRNRELEATCANLLQMIFFSIMWPPVLRFINQWRAGRARKGLLRQTTFVDGENLPACT
jgi:hypothetical protein